MIPPTLDNYICGDYCLQRAHGMSNEALRAEIIAFWQRNRALPADEDGQARSRQVVYVARNTGGEIVGLSSVYVGDFLRAGNPHYFYRMFVQPGDRYYQLTVTLWRRTGELLAAKHADGQPLGLVIVTENPKLLRPALRRLIAKGGYQWIGKDERGCDVWLKAFANAAATAR